MDDDNKLPTFHELRLRHGISLDAIYERANRSLSIEEIQLFDETGRADPYTVDDLLFVLSDLSGAGQYYSRSTVGGITLVLARPPMSPMQPQPLKGSVFSQSTLLELYIAYALDLDWLAEALKLDTSEVWKLMIGPITRRNSSVAERAFQLISQYTGVSYTLTHPITKRQAPVTRPLFSLVP